MKHVEKAGWWNKNGVKKFSSSHHFLESLGRLLSVEHFSPGNLEHSNPSDWTIFNRKPV